MMHMSQQAWVKWADQRALDAQRVAKVYEKQAVQVRAVLLERGCIDCDPMIEMADGEHGGPKPLGINVQHELMCPRQ